MLATKRSGLLAVLVILGLLAGLYLTSLYSYVLFHTLAELVGVAIAFGIFLFAWNSRHLIKNNYLLFLGIAYVFVSVLAIVHTLSYQGMGIFLTFSADPPTQLWIASRYMLGLSYLLAPLFLGRRINPFLVLAIYVAVTALLLLSILYWHIFPVCYVEGVGITAFKKVSEFIISGILVAAAALLWRRRDFFEQPVFRLLIFSIILTIVAELSFTQYVSVYGPANLTGHLFSVLAFYLAYQAIIVTGFRHPVELLFHDLMASEAKYRNIFDNASEGIFQATPAGRLLSVNPSFARMLGFDSAEELVAEVSDVGAQLYANPADRERLKATLEKENRVSGFEVEMKRRDGRHIWVSINSRAVRDARGRTMYYEGTNDDITAKKKADQLKDDFIGMVSHELRTPLTVMLGSLSTLDTPGLSESEKRELIVGAADSAKSMADIVDNLLELSRYQSERLNLSLKPVDVGEVIAPLVRRVSAAYPGHRFRTEIPSEAPRPQADRLRLERIMYNLIDNAAKYSPAGSEVVIRASAADSTLSIAVSDCGVGMSSEQQKRLFQPFGRLDKKSGTPGLGLGLIVCKHLAEAHGGSVCVESLPGRGSTFTLRLPLNQPQQVSTHP